MKLRRITIFASELAAFVGANPYQKPPTALLEIFRRTYPDRAARLGVRSRDEKFNALLEKTGTRTMVAESLAVASEATARDDVSGVTAQASTLSKALDADASLSAPDRAVLKREAVSAMQTHFGTVQETKGVASLEKASMLTTSVAAVDEELASLQREMELQGAAAAPIAAILPQLRVAAKEAVAQALSSPALDALDAGGVLDANVQALPRAAVAAVLEKKAGALMDRAGVAKGSAARVDFEQRAAPQSAKRLRGAFESSAKGAQVVKRDNKWRHRAVGTIDAVPDWAAEAVGGSSSRGVGETTAVEIVIGGRIDGWSKQHGLVEVKNRMRGLFNTVPMYERVQVHAYMYILGGAALAGEGGQVGVAGEENALSHAMLVQRLKRDHAKSSTTKIEWDPELWRRSVVEPLLTHSRVMHRFAHDDELLAHFGSLGGDAAREEDFMAEQLSYAREDRGGPDIFAC